MTELRMAAYFYSFTPTGVEPVDKILSAVATAGKGCHHTEDWMTRYNDKKSCIEVIQEAADHAAAEFSNTEDPQ